MGECNLMASSRVSGLKQVAMELKGKAEHKSASCYRVPWLTKMDEAKETFEENPADCFIC